MAVCIVDVDSEHTPTIQCDNMYGYASIIVLLVCRCMDGVYGYR